MAMHKGLQRVLRFFGSVPRELVITLIVTIVATIAAPSLIALLNGRHRIHLWIAVLMLGVGSFVGLLVGASLDRGRDVEIEDDDRPDRYAAYSEHLQQILDHLQRVIAGDIPGVTFHEFIERGILEPARDMLWQGGEGEIRLSVLAPRGDVFRMSFAAGHTLQGKEKFSLPIKDSISRFAYERGEAYVSQDLDHEVAYTPHPLGSRPYKSIISLPIIGGDRICGVFNTIATSPYAFDEVDVDYVGMLGSIINVATSLILATNQGEDSLAAPG